MREPCSKGDRIELIHMPDDPNPLPAGSQGTVMWVNMLGIGGEYQIAVKWDSGRTLMLVPADQFKIIGRAD